MALVTIHGTYTTIMKNVRDLLGHENWEISITQEKKILTVYTTKTTLTTDDIDVLRPLVAYFQEIKVKSISNIQRFTNKYKCSTGIYGECPICYEPLKDNDVIELACNHTYHASCIKDWVKCDKETSLLCPYCTHNIEL